MNLPIEPLERWFAAAHPPANPKIAEQEEGSGRITAQRLAEATGSTPATVWRWRRYGLPLYSADRAATKLGLHPSHLWPEWWDQPQRREWRRRPKWKLPEFFIEMRAAAIAESWRLRAEARAA